MWECKIELPVRLEIARDETIDTGLRYDLTLVCEPDESVGDTDFWISAVGIEGQMIPPMAPKLREPEAMYWLARNHPLHQEAIKFAMSDLKTLERLRDLWAEWLNDAPARRYDAMRAY